MDTVQIASEVESELHRQLEGINSDGYQLQGARLYGVSFGDKGTPELSFITQHPDVYELLADEANARIANLYNYACVVTTGWAAPLGANGEVEGAPSEHALRRRVRLAVVANRQSVASVLRFQDEPETPITDPGDATGSLADAIRTFVNSGHASLN